MSARLLPVLLFAVVAGCASGPVPDTTTALPPQTIRVGAGGSGGRATINATTTSSFVTVPHPIGDVWSVVPSAYDTLGITKAVIDPGEHFVSNAGVKIRQRLGGTPLSRFIECGTTQIGPNADSYEVFLTVSTQITPAAGGQSNIASIVEAAAKPLNFAQEYARCSSKGVLEQRIADAIKLRLR